MDATARGHRAVPHTADLRIEAWGTSREECIVEAVKGAVASFVDSATVRAERTIDRRFDAGSDEDLLVAVLDEVIYLADTAGEVPVSVALEGGPGWVEARFGLAAAADLPRTGAVPKAVSLHELSLSRGPAGWRCSVTLDV